jgi:hypothetical protein
MRNPTLIVIHGVGDSRSGTSLLGVAEGLRQSGEPGSFANYPSLELSNSIFSRIIEVNWSDVARTSKRNAFKYYIQIIVALLAFGPQMRANATWIPRAYRASFEMLLAFCIYPAFATMLYVSAPSSYGLTSAFVVVAAVGLLTYYLSRFRATFLVGWIWTAYTAFTILGLRAGRLSALTAIQITSFPYIVSQVLTAILLLLALLGVVRSRSSLVNSSEGRIVAQKAH